MRELATLLYIAPLGNNLEGTGRNLKEISDKKNKTKIELHTEIVNYLCA